MEKEPRGTAVDGPEHYKGYRVLQIINEFDLGFELGNVVKYVLRSRNKGGVEDLEKARFYLDWFIRRTKDPLHDE